MSEDRSSPPPWAKGSASGPGGKIFTDGSDWFTQDHAPIGQPAPAAGAAPPPSRQAASAPPPSSAAEKEQPGGRMAALWQGLLRGVGTAVYGAGQIGQHLPGLPDLPGARAGAQRVAEGAAKEEQGAESAYQGSSTRQAHPGWAGAGRIVGEVAPAMLLGPGVGAGRSALGLIGRSALSGALGGATAPVAAGTDYWSEKMKQMEIGGAAGAALPAVGSALAPRLLNPALAGVQGIQRAFRPLYNFVMGAEERTVNGFDRTIARQVLDPIGRDVPRGVSGHALLRHVEDRMSDAYDEVLPHISLPRAALAAPNAEFRRYVDTMSTDHQQRLGRMLSNYVMDRFPANGQPMDGRTFKRVQSELSQRAYSWLGTNDNELGRATYMALNWLNEAIERANPASAAQLSRTNEAFRMFARMREAASRPTAEGKFTPTDLLKTISQQSDAAWRGDQPLQRYAQIARRALGEKDRSSPMELLRMMHPGAALFEATRHSFPGAVRGGVGTVGRGMKALGEPLAPGVGRTEVERRKQPSMEFRLKAAQKVGSIQTDLYNAKRRGDMADVAEKMKDLAAAQADYKAASPRAA